MEDENAFANYVRLPPHMFGVLLNGISTVIQRTDTHMRPAPDAEMKLAMTLNTWLQEIGITPSSMTSYVATALRYGACRKFLRPSHMS